MSLRIEFCHALPERQWLLTLELPAGATVADAVRAAQAAAPDLPDATGCVFGVWSAVVAEPSTHVLSEGDRVEVYRPLQVDPKQARRQRAARIKASSPAP